MARDDMFNWLLRKKKSQPAKAQPKPTETVAKPKLTPAESAPMAPAAVLATEPVVPEKPAEVRPEPAVAEAPAPAVAETPSPTPSEAEPSVAPQARPACAGISRTKRLLVLDRSPVEIMPSAGATVVEHAGRRKRSGVLVRVRADGRRLLAKVGPAGGIRAYTLRYDGAYRLEGVVDARAPELTLARGHDQ
ncbi:hypothetical protein SAMN04488061_0151 [Filomicrobium insigne]|uniref:Uncharacterized protein n=1 Tax=Filomicrobium insigne TaxID=418854 RepID=A0A1H0GGU5_9HYPH|nr:hypothetical protein [Filomicrobium insigne]SDO05959.1 hypothetical protein SAMN04488061_0151 [Filomicrobium insigne]